MPALPENGMIHQLSPYGMAETVKRLESVLASRGIPVMARIDHSEGAARVGLKMRPTEVILFGNAKAGTPMMIGSPTLAIDLPLKVLIWEDEEQEVRVSYNSPEYLGQRHKVPDELLKNISVIGAIVEETVGV